VKRRYLFTFAEAKTPYGVLQGVSADVCHVNSRAIHHLGLLTNDGHEDQGDHAHQVGMLYDVRGTSNNMRSLEYCVDELSADVCHVNIYAPSGTAHERW
jgi:hypothetical protein